MLGELGLHCICNSLVILFNCRFGRRKILGVSFLLAAVGAVGALLLSDKAETDKGA